MPRDRVQVHGRLPAPAARLGPICAGTKAVFEMGIKVLGTAVPPAPTPAQVPLSPLVFDDLPRLAVTVTPETDDRRLAVFLHGIGGARGNWDAQLAVAGGVLHYAALDLRGYSDSTLGPRHSSVDDYCADILRLRERLGADRLVLVGLSYGSWIATSFAMRHPGMLAGLVLSAPRTRALFFPDALAVDPTSVRRVPWANSGHDLLVLSNFTGETAKLCLRASLKSVLARAARAGFVPKYSMELEYTLFDETAESARAKGWRNLKTATPHANHDLFLYQVVQSEWHEAVAAMAEPPRIDLTKMHEEIGGGFMEACIGAGHGTEPADQIVLL